MLQPRHAAALLLLAVSPAAAAPRIPITGPGTITTPGRYILMNDIPQAPSGLCNSILIHATTGQIDLDLGWHAIEPGFLCSAIVVSGASTVTIRNGFLTSNNGTVLVGIDENLIRLDRVHISGDWGISVRGAASLIIRRSTSHATVFSLYFNSAGFLEMDRCRMDGQERDVTVRHAGRVAIKSSTFAGGHSGNPGLELAGIPPRKLSIARSSALGSEDVAWITADGARVHGNVFYGGSVNGLVVTGTGNSILGNTFTNNGACGIVVDSASNTLLGNTFSGNLGGDICEAP